MIIRAGIAISIKDTLLISNFCISGTAPICVQAILVNAGIWHHNISQIGRDLQRLLAQAHAQRRDSSKLIKAQSS